VATTHATQATIMASATRNCTAAAQPKPTSVARVARHAAALSPVRCSSPT
jgi:hypothetical protein